MALSVADACNYCTVYDSELSDSLVFQVLKDLTGHKCYARLPKGVKLL